MSASPNLSAPQPSDSPTIGGIRRHHTISAHTRSARASAKDVISEETFTQEQQQQNFWNDDEVVGEDWVGGVGAVGEKTSLHRQASLPTRSSRRKSFAFSSIISLISPFDKCNQKSLLIRQ